MSAASWRDSKTGTRGGRGTKTVALRFPPSVPAQGYTDERSRYNDIGCDAAVAPETGGYSGLPARPRRALLGRRLAIGWPSTPATPFRLEKDLQIERADARTRTGDPFITSEVLYQLSYVGERRSV
jgi:hypothetical protein